MKDGKSWALEKLNFLPMISDAYRTFEDRKKWYFFMEADTFVSLHNLLIWLRELDHGEPIYAGAQVLISTTEFGHSGSGFLLSTTAVRALAGEYATNQEHWDKFVASECCGDKVMAEVLQAASPAISLLRAFPLIQGETITSHDWSATHWCKPAITWHHVSAAEVDRQYRFELEWHAEHGAKSPILFRDYYSAFVEPLITSTNNNTLDAWDSLSSDWAFDALTPNDPWDSERRCDISVETLWACKHFCKNMRPCVQWTWRPGSYRGVKKVRLGWPMGKRLSLGSAEDRVEKVAGCGCWVVGGEDRGV